MQRAPIIFEDGTFIPRTRLTRFLHLFATVAGGIGIAIDNWDLFFLGGLICLTFDIMRSIESWLLHHRLAWRLHVYAAALLFGTPYFGLLRSAILSALIVGSILSILIPILMLEPRRHWRNSKRRATQVVTRRDMTNQADQ